MFATKLAAQPGPKELKRWQDERYNMFIHWGGIYSVLGSVWDGKPITRGLGEQIQAHAGIYSDSYAKVAEQFNPEKWNADSVALLAKNAGMRAIVFTSKHHDGFCMWNTQTTDFNVVKATPYQRDVIKELSAACKRHGIKLGLYFSNIDWHFPEASPISSHNSDSIPPLHHQYNLAQIRELLTNYGEITELWFDMGSNTFEQSKEMRALVHQLQPNCMIGSRLGNDMGDFTVMSDNQQPDYEIGVPWQSPASFFDETWGYRSWQKYVPEEEKFKEKLTSLINVASRGGKYLLNIGPKGNGEVVPYEKKILLRIGKWLDTNQEAIYDVNPDPFREIFDWGAVTSTPHKIYLLVMKQPKDNVIYLPRIHGHVTTASIFGEPHLKPVLANKGNGQIVLQLPADFSVDADFKVIALSFDKGYEISPTHLLTLGNKPLLLNHQNSFKYYSNSGIDYNSRFKSTVKESWNLKTAHAKTIKPVLWYTDQERGKKIDLTFDGKQTTVELKGDKAIVLQGDKTAVRWEKSYVAGPFFEGIGEINSQDPLLDMHKNWKNKAWIENPHAGKLKLPADRMACYYYAQKIIADKETSVLINLTSADGIALALNGENLLLHNNDKRAGEKQDVVLLKLKKGINQLLIKSNNMFQRQVVIEVDRNIPQQLYRKVLTPINVNKGKVYSLSWALHQPFTIHETMNMVNLSLDLQ
ncbi:alpha-L-fucosidase [Olivibacter domesticus]|uniref:alpha-L-fucosidase n=1 Tax=Olivibacter domesticus TaxID=407022 RepID=A0A1H7UQY2_OLID1|nr:alpha-L-fucosidase [Olivibacter domesticus]SEL99363.1 alpha-L-fucosidase [Olivibacter domesticus]